MGKMKKFISAAVVMLCMLCLFPFVQNDTVKAVEQDKKSDKRDYIIVSMGDSYSSGEGVPDFYGQSKDWNEKMYNEDWLAHRSTQSWPGQLTLNNGKIIMSKYKDKNWFFVASSGAVTANFSQSQEKYVYRTVKSSLAGTIDTVPIVYSNREYLSPQLNIFQDEKLEGKKIDYVTMTIGGNDVGFSDVIMTAATNFGDVQKLPDKINATWNNYDDYIRDNIYQAYMDVNSALISQESGDSAKIIVAGYPRLIADGGSGFLFNEADADEINTAVTRFNRELNAIVNECKAQGVKICFVPVEDKFKGHEAYTKDPWINPVMIATQSEDLTDLAYAYYDDNTGKPKLKGGASAYSIHPNSDGTKAYAECVQAKIDEIEADGGASEWPEFSSSDERDVVLVLDTSGSMEGDTIEETKKAAKKFVSTVLQEDASIGIVNYASESYKVADFNKSQSYLDNAIDGLSCGGGTNIGEALEDAREMLENSHAKKKIIVLMSDGAANEGILGDELISEAASIKKDDVTIYTLGFFDALTDEKADAQMIMEKMASDGCHYEVSDANDLVFFFGDIADQLTGQKYIYVKIACPVDVKVEYKGETLNSSVDDQNTRTDFGSLTFVENENQEDDPVKVLRLKEGADYDISIIGTGNGTMDYSIGFMDDNGKYSDMRYFENVRINEKTKIDTVAARADFTDLKVDSNGDGVYDLKYRAGKNADAEIVNDTYLMYIAYGLVVLLFAVIIILRLVRFFKKRAQII